MKKHPLRVKVWRQELGEREGKKPVTVKRLGEKSRGCPHENAARLLPAMPTNNLVASIVMPMETCVGLLEARDDVMSVFCLVL